MKYDVKINIIPHDHISCYSCQMSTCINKLHTQLYYIVYTIPLNRVASMKNLY